MWNVVDVERESGGGARIGAERPWQPIKVWIRGRAQPDDIAKKGEVIG